MVFISPGPSHPTLHFDSSELKYNYTQKKLMSSCILTINRRLINDLIKIFLCELNQFYYANLKPTVL